MSLLKLRGLLAVCKTIVILSIALVGLLLTLIHVVWGHNYAIRRTKLVHTQCYNDAKKHYILLSSL